MTGSAGADRWDGRASVHHSGHGCAVSLNATGLEWAWFGSWCEAVNHAYARPDALRHMEPTS